MGEDKQAHRPGSYIQQRVISAINALIDRYGRPVGAGSVATYLGVEVVLVERSLEELVKEGAVIATQRGLYASPETLSILGRVAYEHSFATHVRVLRRMASREASLSREDVLAWCERVERLFE